MNTWNMISYCFNKKLFQVHQVCWDPLSQHAQVHHHTSGNSNFINIIEFFYDSIQQIVLNQHTLKLTKTKTRHCIPGDSFPHICNWLHGPFTFRQGGQLRRIMIYKPWLLIICHGHHHHLGRSGFTHPGCHNHEHRVGSWAGSGFTHPDF